jgi:uncharacterized repeat protein (TIGR01451 family)
MLVFSSLAYAQPDIGQPDNILIYQFPFTGSASFDLTINETQTLNGIDPSTVTVTYYETLVDAQTQSFAIPTPTSWVNTTNPQTFYVNLVEDSTGLFSTASFDVEVLEDVVNIPDANFLARLISIGVDTNGSGNIQYFEAEAVTSLGLNQSNISDLTGIEAFVNLVTLNFTNNNVTGDLDFSANTLLETIVCVSNQISTVNLANNTNLRVFEAWANPLIDIDVSNNLLLESLGISGSEIEVLDLNNNINLLDLSIASNQFLKTVFIKNNSDESTNIDSGSWLENWIISNNPSLEYVCADANQVSEIQEFAGADYVVNSFCDFEPGGDYNTITGVSQVDVDNDGCDASDQIVPFLNIEIGNGPATLVPATTTNSVGVYNIFLGQTGDYTVQPNLENPSYFTITPNFPNVNIPFIDNGSTTQDFCLTANGTIADAEVIIAPVFPSRPGFDATYKLVFKNKGNQVLSGSVDFQYDDTVLDFVSSTEAPDFQDSGELSFNFTNLEPFESRSIDITVNVNGPTETPPINIDDVLDYNSTISLDQTEETPEDNSFNYSEIVVGAFDPNDITCLQGEIVPDTQIGEFLHYMIRFENTGNSPAENVVVTTDINPDDFELSTLQVLNASHDMVVRNNNGVIEFVFENILLSGGGGHGNILLKIRTKDILTPSDEVEAQADIYFDFNFPIETNVANTAFSVLSTQQFSDEQNIVVYPNPSDSFIRIEASIQFNNISILDIQGRVVLTQNTTENAFNSSIDISNLSKGVYVIQLETSKGKLTKKLIKE